MRAVPWVIAGAAGLVSACVSAPPAPPPSAAPQREAAGETGGIAAALQQVLEGHRPLEGLRIRVDWNKGEGLTSAEIYGTGVTIWNAREQLPASRERILSAVAALQDARFGTMPAEFGEENDMLRLAGRIAVVVGPLEKTVVQYGTGPRSETLAAAADRILELAREPGEAGTTAGSLTEGLRRVADGTLAPETFSLSIVQRSETAAAAGRGPDGWLLQLTGREARVQLYDRRAGYAPAHSLLLTPAELRSLAVRLRDAGVENYPGSLRATGYTDLSVRVLDQARSVIARRTLETSDSHPREQESFDRLIETLERLRDRVLRG
jgi:hypothetical protein